MMSFRSNRLAYIEDLDSDPEVQESLHEVYVTNQWLDPHGSEQGWNPEVIGDKPIDQYDSITVSKIVQYSIVYLDPSESEAEALANNFVSNKRAKDGVAILRIKERSILNEKGWEFNGSRNNLFLRYNSKYDMMFYIDPNINRLPTEDQLRKIFRWLSDNLDPKSGDCNVGFEVDIEKEILNEQGIVASIGRADRLAYIEDLDANPEIKRITTSRWINANAFEGNSDYRWSDEIQQIKSCGPHDKVGFPTAVYVNSGGMSVGVTCLAPSISRELYYYTGEDLLLAFAGNGKNVVGESGQQKVNLEKIEAAVLKNIDKVRGELNGKMCGFEVFGLDKDLIQTLAIELGR